MNINFFKLPLSHFLKENNIFLNKKKWLIYTKNIYKILNLRNNNKNKIKYINK